MTLRHWSLVVLGIAFLSGPRIWAQAKHGEFEKKSDVGTIELRFGAQEGRASGLVETGGRQFAAGVGVLAYLGQGRVTHRTNFNFALDVLPLSSTDFFDQSLGARARINKTLLILNPGLGFDVVQSPHVDVALHYGGAIVRNFTTFQLRDTSGQFQDVCDLEAFRSRCPARWSFLGNAGASARFFPRRDKPFYFGIDYTRYALGRNQIVGTIGFAF